MHRIIALLIILLPCLTLQAQKKQAIIRISQDESFLLDKYYTEITLKRKSFKIQVLLSGVAGIYSFAGFTDSICCKYGEADTIPHFTNMPEMTMAEADFNPEKEMLVGEESCSYWYFDPQLNSHRFNKKVVLLDSNRYVGIKTVKQLYHVAKKKEIKVKDLKTPLYIFFVAVEEVDANGRPTRELMRRKVRINWSHED